jgi:hypothetical protein
MVFESASDSKTYPFIIKKNIFVVTTRPGKNTTDLGSGWSERKRGN